MIAPRDDLAGRIHAARAIVPARGTIEIVLHVVFARPHELHRYLYFLRDRRSLDHVIVVEATSETTTHAREVHGDVRVLHTECAHDELASRFGILRGRPHLER